MSQLVLISCTQPMLMQLAQLLPGGGIVQLKKDCKHKKKAFQVLLKELSYTGRAGKTTAYSIAHHTLLKKPNTIQKVTAKQTEENMLYISNF